LPRYRGANPIQRAIINGDKETGICTMITELGLDCGDICQKLVIPISETMNCGELWEEIAQKSPKMIEETLIGLKNQTLCPEKQCEDGVCMANKLTKDECLIDWNKSNQRIHNLVRGVCRCPSAYFIFNDKIIKVIETAPVEGYGEAGKIVGFSKEGVDFACGEGLLRLIKVKPEGKGEMLAKDWYNGVKH
jgi:methionyl-tRNA formyltransferase